MLKDIFHFPTGTGTYEGDTSRHSQQLGVNIIQLYGSFFHNINLFSNLIFTHLSMNQTFFLTLTILFELFHLKVVLLVPA